VRFLVIAGSVEPLRLEDVGDAPLRSNRYRDELTASGKLVLHAHVAGHRAHVWVFDVDSVDELDQVMADDPMSPFFSGSPQILPLVSASRMAARAQAFERLLGTGEDGWSRLEAETIVNAPAGAVFEEACDIEARARDLPAFQRVEIDERTDDGFVATMWEHYGGRDVVIRSRFRFERPGWVTYEHLESPYGENRGRFTIEQTAEGTRLHQVHETKQDVSEGTTLRGEWLKLIDEQLDAIRAGAERRAAR
jgi:muconolactone delta-isomerase